MKVLVFFLFHGFGAFLEHYRDNVQSIADGRNQVYVVTLLGFGESEKPDIVYTELMWAELLRDFIIEVVGEPLHLVGNSMGGYFAALVGGLWPSLTKSVTLINTAFLFFKERETSRLAWLGSRLLLQYLRFSLSSIVKSAIQLLVVLLHDPFYMLQRLYLYVSDPCSPFIDDLILSKSSP